MTLAFTICSNNYLAHAKTLGDSFMQHHPDAKFVIGLVDKVNEEFDYSFFSKFEIIPVDVLQIDKFEELNTKYNITELNTAVKPSYIHHLFKNYDVDKLMYIDPDILVTSRFDEVLTLLDDNNIVITPHIFTPVDDGFMPTDFHTLKGGVFNLGFIALSHYSEIYDFVCWWHDRVIKYGFSDLKRNMFYDQLWINYVPVMFKKYFILMHPGYNMANWNLHERYLTKGSDGAYLVNENFPLRFFHFSSYKYNAPDKICAYHTRFSFKARPDLVEIFHLYQEKLEQNRVHEIAKLTVFYYPQLGKSASKKKKNSVIQKINWRFNTAVKVLLTGKVE